MRNYPLQYFAVGTIFVVLGLALLIASAPAGLGLIGFGLAGYGFAWVYALRR